MPRIFMNLRKFNQLSKKGRKKTLPVCLGFGLDSSADEFMGILQSPDIFVYLLDII
ncbi:MAG TPA: hypothetical protein VEG44_01595 [Candidatus Acidoferrales bacterium]|nr:hypothetical protein [Candidatus Acidoferrales bacterium]